MKKERIAIIMPADLPVPAVLGGAIETIAQLGLEQNERHKQFQIVVFSAFNMASKKLSDQYEQAQFVWMRRGRLFHFLNFFIRILRKFLFKNLDHLDGLILAHRVRRDNFDKVVVYGHAMHLIALAKVVPREKLIFYIHANLFDRPTALSAAVGTAAQRYLMVSEFTRDHMIKMANIDPSKCFVIKNPIDLDRFRFSVNADRPADLVQRYKIGPDDVVLLYVGRIVTYKGVKEILMAAGSLPDNVRFKLLVVGSFGSGFGKGHQKTAFQDELISLAQSAAGRIVFTGFVHNSELPKYHALSDVVLMPSLYEEPAGMVAMEAMASGRPVITTNAGGIPEYVTPDCGIILNRGDNFVSDLASAMLQLVQDKDKRRMMGSAGVAESRKFAPEIYYANYVKLVSGLI